jgi:hypothetical protein
LASSAPLHILANYNLPLNKGVSSKGRLSVSVNSQEIKLYLTSDEFRLIFDYQLANKPLFKKLSAINADLLAKRPNFKRVNVTLNLAELDLLLLNISQEANKINNAPSNQYLLDSLFGKLSSKYNEIAFQ